MLVVVCFVELVVDDATKGMPYREAGYRSWLLAPEMLMARCIQVK